MNTSVDVWLYIEQLLKNSVSKEKKGYKFIRSAVDKASKKFSIPVSVLEADLEEVVKYFDAFSRSSKGLAVYHMSKGGLPKDVVMAEINYRSMKSPKRAKKSPFVDEEAIE